MPVTRITIGGKTINTEDIPFQIFVDVSRETGIEWTTLWGAPLADATAAVMFLEAVAEVLGVELPLLTPKVLVGMVDFEPEEHTRPEAYVDGLPFVTPPGVPLPENDQPTP